MNNPWTDLPLTIPYVLEDDFKPIREHNRRAKSIFQVELEMLPEPFLGLPTAPVVLLNLNPGVGEGDVEQHRESQFRELSRQNLHHADNATYPFYLLNPAINDSPGYEWWYARLRELIEECGHQAVAQRVLCVELFPYHSERYKPVRVPSQKYSFHLVREAMKRQAVIIQMRSRRLWFNHVPELQEYPHWYELNSPQATYVTENNCPDGYAEVVAAISNS